MDSPTISVVMSVFNGEAFLCEAVESILAQTFGDFEFIIIDDGSTDKTSEILSDYAKRDNRVRLVEQENRGRADSLNRGIEFARASLIARMDADDISLPHRLKEQVDFLNHHPEVGLLSGAFDLIGSENKILDTIRLPAEDPEIGTRMLDYNAICHPAVVMRKNVALASGGYRKQLLDADDYDLWLRMAERTHLANLDSIILKYRVHPGQASIRNMQHQTWCILAARTAASFRRSGRPDPLSNLQEVTPASLAALGVTEWEIRSMLIDIHRYWISVLYQSDPEVALRVSDDVLHLSKTQRVERTVLADLWLGAAAIQYKHGRLLEALFSAGRGLLTRPVVAGRPVKKALARLAGSLRT